MMEKTQAKPLTAAQQRQRDKKRRTWLRTGVQLFFFVSMPGAFVAGFSGEIQKFSPPGGEPAANFGGTVAIPAGGADPGGSGKPAQAGNCRS